MAHLCTRQRFAGATPTSLSWRISSGLDWTIVRPVQLIDKPLSGNYRTGYGQIVRRGLLISRADVAYLMLRVLEQPDSIRQSIAIAY